MALTAGFCAMAQDAFMSYNLQELSFNVPADMRMVKDGTAMKIFVSEVGAENARISLSRETIQVGKSYTLQHYFGYLAERYTRCGDTATAYKNKGRLQYKVAEAVCTKEGAEQQYAYIAAIQTPSGYYHFSATCPYAYKEKYRPMFRKTLSSVQLSQ